jgi:SNF2 family DNA or RNA helicase
VPVTLNAIQQKMTDQIKQDLWTLDQKGEPLHSPNVLSMLNRLRQIAVATPDVLSDEWDEIEQRRIIKVKLIEPSSKLDAAMDIIEGLEWDAERKDQIVCFSFFRDPIELLKTRLDKARISYLHMHTGLSESDMYEMWHETWPKGEHQVFLSTLGKGAESINLTAAHRCIFLDQSWSPVQNNQAIGRVYRPGQTEPAQLIYIRAEGTVDYRVLGANQEKTGWFKQIFGDVDDTEM